VARAVPSREIQRKGEGPPLEDAVLVERARHGDVSAYDVLVCRYQALATRAAYLILGDAAEAEDAAQEAFVKAYYALARFQAGRPFRPWLLRIVSNEAHNRQAADSRRTALLLRAAETQRAGDAGTSPEGVTLRAERRTALLRALATLSADDRLIITYRYFLDLSEVEMADALDCPRGTVKSRLSRALGRLRATLGNDSAQAGDEGGATRV
jgi:RNA polymerase sigma factor (sigma-70 family)